jgi:hypothetical protein
LNVRRLGCPSLASPTTELRGSKRHAKIAGIDLSGFWQSNLENLLIRELNLGGFWQAVGTVDMACYRRLCDAKMAFVCQRGI